VGSDHFVERIKGVPGRQATGRNLVEKERIFHLREHAVPYKGQFWH
jgi:hypothetical protein